MKILIIAKYFPPQNSIASLRPYSWAKWWSNLGHEVTVVSTKKIPWENDLKLDCSGFDLIEIPVPVGSFLDRINPIAASPLLEEMFQKIIKEVCQSLQVHLLLELL